MRRGIESLIHRFIDSFGERAPEYELIYRAAIWLILVSATSAVAAEPLIDPEIIKARDARSRLEALKESEVAGQINGYYQQWQKLTSQEARALLAQRAAGGRVPAHARS